jgi:hypothetical protein
MDEIRPQTTSIIWPIIIITIGLFIYVISQFAMMERTTIMNNWPEMRCNTFVMFAAYWLKPELDPRSAADFAADNFKFCSKSLVQGVMKIVMTPFGTVLQAQAEITKVFTMILNAIKTIITNLFNSFMSFLEPVFKKFNAVTYQIGILMQKMKMAFERINTALLTIAFSGISVVKGISNAIQFVIKVVLIILAIMVAIIIFLFFILFPFIPILITPVLVAIIAVGAAVGAEAKDDQAAFCFTGDTPILLADGSTKPISEITIGQSLEGGGTVEAILTMDGTRTSLYDLMGVHVSGSHLVLGTGGWHSVAEDPRAVLLNTQSDLLYCLNTSNQQIPVRSSEGPLLFRDWEEIDSRDTVGQKGWNRLVGSLIGGLQPTTDDMASLLDPLILVPTTQGPKPLEALQIGDEIELSYNCSTRILGLVEGRIEGSYTRHWISGVIERNYSSTGHCRVTTTSPSTDFLRGNHVITDSGTLVIYTNGQVRKIRDFTEVGIDQIHKTYPFVAERLATFV